MKRVLCLAFAGILCLAFAGCNTDMPDDPLETPEETLPEEKLPVFNVPFEPVDVNEAFEKREFTAESGLTLPYRLFIPDGYDPEASYPVFLFLHGAGERGDDNELQLANVLPNLFGDLTSPVYGAIVICPQCPSDQLWVDVSWKNGTYSTDEIPESEELTAVVELLKSIRAEYNVDESRMYVMGISMGGYGTWDLLVRHPELFAAAIPVCGAGDVSKAELLADMPIHTAHGMNDTTVPSSGTQEMFDAITTAGNTVSTAEYLEGYGHDVWTYLSEKEGLMEWLFTQSRSAE